MREKFEQYRYVTDPAVLDVLLHKGRQDYQVSFCKALCRAHERQCDRNPLASLFHGTDAYLFVQETMNCWKQEPHILGGLLRDPHEGSAVGQTFLQKFYAGESCFCVLR
jgi:NADH dehydrogenase (ubiquinone) 1 alpha subcomplex subunit 6